MPPFFLSLEVFEGDCPEDAISLRSCRLCCKTRVTSLDRTGLHTSSDLSMVTALEGGGVPGETPFVLAASHSTLELA